jgi:hypothetical protein
VRPRASLSHGRSAARERISAEVGFVTFAEAVRQAVQGKPRRRTSRLAGPQKAERGVHLLPGAKMRDVRWPVDGARTAMPTGTASGIVSNVDRESYLRGCCC